MTLTQQQIEGIKNLYGDNSNDAERAIELIRKKRGTFKFFNEDGTVNISKEELEKKINKPSKQSTTPETDKPSVVSLLNQAKKEIKKMKDLVGYESILKGLKSTYEELTKKKEELKEAEIARLDNEIKELQEKKSKLLNNETK